MKRILIGLAIVCAAFPVFAQQGFLPAHGSGPPTSLNPAADCGRYQLYTDDLTGTAYASVAATAGTPCRWAAAAAPAPYVKANNFVAETVSATASITTASPTTVAVGDLVIVACRGAMTIASDNASDSLANTWHAANFASIAAAQGIQVNWSSITVQGSDSFTCTPSATVSAQSMVVVDFAGAGSSLLASTTNSATGPSAYYQLATSLTASARSLLVNCASVGSNSIGWEVSYINGTPATFAQFSSTGGSSTDMNCSFIVLPQASAGAVAVSSQLSSSIGNWINILAAFSY